MRAWVLWGSPTRVGRSAGRLVDRSATQQVGRSAIQLVGTSAGGQVSKSAGQQVGRSAGRQASRSAGRQVVIGLNCPPKMACECGFLLKSERCKSDAPFHDEAPGGALCPPLRGREHEDSEMILRGSGEAPASRLRCF